MLSTHVEVVRRGGCVMAARKRALHARGGGPTSYPRSAGSTRCSPRTWRWSGSVNAPLRRTRVLSTHVEVVRQSSSSQHAPGSALHARGGGPAPVRLASHPPTCSPRTWRWSGSVNAPLRRTRVLSTHVEVVRLYVRDCNSPTRALHARGGGPPPTGRDRHGARCSPRTWRWSGARGFNRAAVCVLSTHVEVVRGR